MSKVLSVAKWSFEMLSKRIASHRSQRVVSLSGIYGECAYDESQMMENNEAERIQRAWLDYDC